jgi:hypothetical protein
MDELQACTEQTLPEQPCSSPNILEPEKPCEEELQTLQLLNVLLAVLDKVHELTSLELEVSEPPSPKP